MIWPEGVFSNFNLQEDYFEHERRLERQVRLDHSRGGSRNGRDDRQHRRRFLHRTRPKCRLRVHRHDPVLTGIKLSKLDRPNDSSGAIRRPFFL